MSCSKEQLQIAMRRALERRGDRFACGRDDYSDLPVFVMNHRWRDFFRDDDWDCYTIAGLRRYEEHDRRGRYYEYCQLRFFDTVPDHLVIVTSRMKNNVSSFRIPGV
jgi:hypothetical protein